jgi:hypothetical protein
MAVYAVTVLTFVAGIVLLSIGVSGMTRWWLRRSRPMGSHPVTLANRSDGFIEVHFDDQSWHLVFPPEESRTLGENLVMVSEAAIQGRRKE